MQNLVTGWPNHIGDKGSLAKRLVLWLIMLLALLTLTGYLQGHSAQILLPGEL